MIGSVYSPGSFWRAAGGGAGYNPIAALGTDLIAYWDANYPAKMTLDGSNNATAWRDMVADYDATGTGVWSATSFNGAPGMAFNGTSDVFTSTAAGLLAALPAGAAPCELWTLVSQDALAADLNTRMSLAYGGSATNVSRSARRQSAGTNVALIVTGDGVSPIAPTALGDFSSRHVVRGVISATATSISLDGATPVSSAVIPATTVDRLRVGASNAASAGNFWQGKIAVAMVTLPLSADKAAGLQSYLLGRRRL